jgi:hypothetical protein
MPNIQYHLGKLPAQPARPHLKLQTALVNIPLPAPPETVDWHSAIPDWPVYGNNIYGCCVWSAIGHEIQQKTQYATGDDVQVTTADLLTGYSVVTGFNPNDPRTDNGTYVQDALKYWRTQGIGGAHRIILYAEVQVGDLNEVKQAVQLFGDLHIGFSFPESAMSQFNNRQPWTVVPGSTIEGGHAVTVVGYDTEYLYVVTWGAVQRMSWAFFQAYCDEAWCVLTPEWINKETNTSAGGIDLYSLGQSFQALTGEPNPIPIPEPGPSPVPELVPAADRVLWHTTREWALARHTGCNRKAAEAVRLWAKNWGMP